MPARVPHAVECPTRCTAVVAAAVSMLDQCRGLVVVLSEATYTTESRTLAGGTIGKHLRHVLDHYQAVLSGVGSDCSVDYDERERNVPMETDRGAAIEGIDRVLAGLDGVRACDPGLPLRLRVMVAADGTSLELSSTLGRELAFATHHAVHHQAMIAAIARELGSPVDVRFGRAPSTLHFEDAGATQS